MEAKIDFESLGEWLAYRDLRRDLFETANFDAWGTAVLGDGCIEPLTRTRIEGSELDAGPSWREGLTYRGIGSRVRSVMRVIETIIEDNQLTSPRIYAAEALTPFALRLRGQYPRFLGSEFTLNPERREWMYPIPHEDIQNLSLPSGAFDIVSTNEVLEHVPSIDKSLAEIQRVLRPGGWHVGTVPFHYFEDESLRRAMLDGDGNIVHLMEPEYHGDPMNEGGVLVFEVPGWDIIGRAKQLGFQRAFMRFMISTEYGVVAEHIGGVFVFCCQR